MKFYCIVMDQIEHDAPPIILESNLTLGSHEKAKERRAKLVKRYKNRKFAILKCEAATYSDTLNLVEMLTESAEKLDKMGTMVRELNLILQRFEEDAN